MTLTFSGLAPRSELALERKYLTLLGAAICNVITRGQHLGKVTRRDCEGIGGVWALSALLVSLPVSNEQNSFTHTSTAHRR